MAQRCAECGFSYAADSVVFRPARPWRIYLLFAAALAILPGLLSFLETTLARLERPTPLQTLFAAAAIILLVWCGRRLRVLLEPNRYVAITPSGVAARTPRITARLGWHEMREITLRGSIPLIYRHANEPPVLLEWVFDPGEVDLFRAELQNVSRRWAQQVIPWRDAQFRSDLD